MLERLANVFYWLCTGVAALFGILAIFVLVVGDKGFWVVGSWAVGFLVLAIVVWLIGRAARYILAGR